MERDFLAWLRQRIGPSPRAPLGLGDDAAQLLLAGSGCCLVTTDMLMDGIDFELAQITADRAGRKALAVNLSDLAAMAARPVAAFVSLALPRRGGRALAEALYAGLLPLAEQFDVAIAGGDTNTWNGPLVISLTAVGEATDLGPLTRSGGRPGDVLVVTGQFGGSLLGKHLDFLPRVREALLLHAQYGVRAGIDVSDGLSLDLARLASESGCGVLLETQAVPIADAARELAARGSGQTALDHALSDGEDFELVLAVPPDKAAELLAQQPLAVPLTALGTLTAEPGLWQVSPAGARSPLVPRGYEHGEDS